jgi:hypothetical protein
MIQEGIQMRIQQTENVRDYGKLSVALKEYI